MKGLGKKGRGDKDKRKKNVSGRKWRNGKGKQREGEKNEWVLKKTEELKKWKRVEGKKNKQYTTMTRREKRIRETDKYTQRETDTHKQSSRHRNTSPGTHKRQRR